MINNVYLKYYSKVPHLSMVIAGFVLLKKLGKIRQLRVVDASSENINSSTRWIAEAIINRELRIAYDVCDGYINFDKIDDRYANEVDYYFLRSYSNGVKKRYFPNANVRPLGMNYYCTTIGNPFDRSGNIIELGKKCIKTLIYPFNPQLGRAFKVTQYEFPPMYDGKSTPTFIFNTRLWNPQGDVGEKKWERMHPERVHMNELRTEIIRRARKEYSSCFQGGIYDTEYARKYSPELILPNQRTNKKQYLRTMRGYDVCIGSAGLHGSIGWKTAEYIASSKAIILEKPIYSVPGNFEEGKNYFGFLSVDECLSAIQYLIDHRSIVREMQNNNQQYYEKFLRPDQQVYNSLKVALLC